MFYTIFIRLVSLPDDGRNDQGLNVKLWRIRAYQAPVYEIQIFETDTKPGGSPIVWHYGK